MAGIFSGFREADTVYKLEELWLATAREGTSRKANELRAALDFTPARPGEAWANMRQIDGEARAVLRLLQLDITPEEVRNYLASAKPADSAKWLTDLKEFPKSAKNNYRFVP